MNINLIVEPTTVPMSFETFVKTKPPFSIALDGYVKGASNSLWAESGLYVNFNHHEDVNRLATRCTSAQVLIALRQKLISGFKSNKNLKNEINIYVNDCDQDVCLSYFLLKYSWRFQTHTEPIINKLVFIEDMLDTCSGAYPFPEGMPAIKEVDWLFEPYTRFRDIGGLDKRSASDFEGVIIDVNLRLSLYVNGQLQPEQFKEDISKYEVIGGNEHWRLVTESGPNCRSKMLLDGITVFASVRKRPNGNYTYSIGKISPFVDFDIHKAISKLNEVEKCHGDVWGGSDTIGGSPRVLGSTLPPHEFEKVINSLF